MNPIKFEHPILYTFRRCPYAMRARLALYACQIQVEVREVVLKNKPNAMLEISPKATVPVLQLPGGRVIDESLDIMKWAVRQNDPEQWWTHLNSEQQFIADQLITRNDEEFKHWLDRYKYSVGYPERSQQDYRDEAEAFLKTLEAKLNISDYLLTEKPTLVDMAIFPFVRQFAFVDKSWFEQAPYPKLNHWLKRLLEFEVFQCIMVKHQPWESGANSVWLFDYKS